MSRRWTCSRQEAHRLRGVPAELKRSAISEHWALSSAVPGQPFAACQPPKGASHRGSRPEHAGRLLCSVPASSRQCLQRPTACLPARSGASWHSPGLQHVLLRTQPCSEGANAGPTIEPTREAGWWRQVFLSLPAGACEGVQAWGGCPSGLIDLGQKLHEENQTEGV